MFVLFPHSRSWTLLFVLRFLGFKKSISSTLAIMEEEAVFEDVNTELIQLMHKHNNLYDKSAKDYKDNLKRRESWAEIVIII